METATTLTHPYDNYHTDMAPPPQDLSDLRFDSPTLNDRPGRSIVLRDLESLGPVQFPSKKSGEATRSPPFSLPQAERYCWKLATTHYENFSVASWLFPKRFRQDIANLYAFSRWGDDFSDEIASDRESLELLQWWGDHLEDCFAGRASHPIFVALTHTLSRYPLGPAPFFDLLDAFQQDRKQNRYQTDEELLDYCRRSANPVGRIILAMADCASPTHDTYSDAICTGLQIANFCQDMRGDAKRGRIYLPRERWEGHEISEEVILATRFTPELSKGLEGWCNSAEACFREGIPLVRLVPRWLARNLQLFTRGGVEILDTIRRNQYDVWSTSLVVSSTAKLRIMARSLLFPRSTSISRRTTG